MGMVEVQITSNVDLGRMLTHSAFMQRTIRSGVRRVLTKARRDTERAIAAALQNDPRRASKAVRKLNYKRDFGGNLNILSTRANDVRVSLPVRPLRHGAGGNRLKRSQRTEALLSYYGRDRGFILRFLNNGTSVRTSRYGNRGALSQMFDFQDIATQAINSHMGEIQKQLDHDIQ